MADSFSSLISLLERVIDLKLLPRTGWLFAGVSQPESIADHSFAVSVMALLIAEEINRDFVAYQLDRPLDIGRAVQIAIAHDFAESVLTDLPKRSSELIGETAKHEAERSALTTMLADHPAAESMIRHWDEYSEVSTPEGRLVRDVDKLEMIHQALRYERAGNRNLQEFFRTHRWHYAISESIYLALCESRN